MHKSQERVQFFPSESSFGSESSLSNSRYYDFTNEIIAETDNIFITLKKELLPNQNLNQQEKIKFTINRAQLIEKVTIPQHIIYLKKVESPANAQEEVKKCGQKLRKMLKDYEQLKKGTMIYKQFYNLYGKQFGNYAVNSFSRKQEVQEVESNDHHMSLKPEYIQINYHGDSQRLRGATRVFNVPDTSTKEKQINALMEEVNQLKIQHHLTKKRYEMELANQQLLAEKRVRNCLKAQADGYIIGKNTKNQEIKQSQDRAYTIQKSIHLQRQLQSQHRLIEQLKNQANSLRQELSHYRKQDINMAEQNVGQHDKSYASDADAKNQQKIGKQLRNLKNQNQLLKNQLKNQRERIYKQKKEQGDQEKRDNERTKKLLEKKNKELEQLYLECDRQKVQILQLKHGAKGTNKLNQSLKNQNEEFAKQLQGLNEFKSNAANLLSFSNQQYASNSSLVTQPTLHVSDYDGQGVEGYPYYQILSKQFKTRFRRACLNEKELLYKANGIEIGVISQFQEPNQINILVHITNYGEKNLLGTKIKIMNANDNKIQGDHFQFQNISPNEQIKLPIVLSIYHYPIGPLILLFDSKVNDKRQELRMLLPAHIFKMMDPQERSQAMRNPKRISLSTDRKIAKDLNDLRNYFKNINPEKGSIKMSLFHKQTHTVTFLDISQNKDSIELAYENAEGSLAITDYYIKTLVFLLSK